MPKRRKIQTNLKRCPLLKVTLEDQELDKDGKPTGRRTVSQEFNECYKDYCMAWTGSCCSYFDNVSVEDEDGEEEV